MMIFTTKTKVKLGAHQPVSQVLLALQQDVGLSDGDIARAIGVNERTVRRWATGTAPNLTTAERIDDLRTIVLELGKVLEPINIIAWLRNRNPDLDQQRPLDVLAEQGGFRRITNAIEAFMSGDYA